MEFYRVNIGESHLARLIADESARDTERLDYLYSQALMALFIVVPSLSDGLIRVQPARADRSARDWARGGRREAVSGSRGSGPAGRRRWPHPPSG